MTGTTEPLGAQGRALADIVGSSHINGCYAFTDEDSLNEGASMLLDMGTRVIKVIMREDPSGSYRFNTRWPDVRSLADMADTTYFRRLFAKPFSTFILMAFPLERPIHYFLDGFTADDAEAETGRMYAFARRLLTSNAGTGKTFIIQNWESDWVLTPPAGPTNPEPTGAVDEASAERMVAWCRARQEGVERARREVDAQGVRVLHALEVNLLRPALAGRPCVTTSVVPHTQCDLYSYSAWETQNDAVLFREALSCLRDNAPVSTTCGRDNVYVGEYGAPENEVGGPEAQEKMIRSATETALSWGARYVVYWQLCCNEPAHAYEGRPTNADMRGFWLVRPDGTRPPVYDTLRSMVAG